MAAPGATPHRARGRDIDEDHITMNRSAWRTGSRFQDLFRNFQVGFQAGISILDSSVSVCEVAVADVWFVVLTVLFMAASVGYVAFCDWLMK